MLLKRGGKLIYSGPIGPHGDDLVSFFSVRLTLERIPEHAKGHDLQGVAQCASVTQSSGHSQGC